MGLYRRYGEKDKYKERIRNVIIAAVLICLAVVTLFPIYYMIISSFGAPTEAGGASYSLIPKAFTLDSYKFFFGYSKYSFRWILNSMLVAGVVTVCNVVFASLAGICVCKTAFSRVQGILFLAACSNDDSLSGDTGSALYFDGQCVKTAGYLCSAYRADIGDMLQCVFGKTVFHIPSDFSN